MTMRTRAVLSKAVAAILRLAESRTQRMVVVAATVAVIVVVMSGVSVFVHVTAAAEVVAVVCGAVAPQNAQRIGTRGDDIHRQQQH